VPAVDCAAAPAGPAGPATVTVARRDGQAPGPSIMMPVRAETGTVTVPGPGGAGRALPTSWQSCAPGNGLRATVSGSNSESGCSRRHFSEVHCNYTPGRGL
jgi:hypothetical protein